MTYRAALLMSVLALALRTSFVAGTIDSSYPASCVCECTDTDTESTGSCSATEEASTGFYNAGPCSTCCGGSCIATCPTTCKGAVSKLDGTCESDSPASGSGLRQDGECRCGEKCIVACPEPTTITCVGNSGRAGTCSIRPVADQEVDGDEGGCATCAKCYTPPCPPSCTVTFTSKNKAVTTLPGTCEKVAKPNTVSGGQGDCPTGCGECYIDSFDKTLCGASVNGRCAGQGTCGCFNTRAGGSCNNAVNVLGSIGTGGGCEENNCNALPGSTKACCPIGCAI